MIVFTIFGLYLFVGMLRWLVMHGWKNAVVGVREGVHIEHRCTRCYPTPLRPLAVTLLLGTTLDVLFWPANLGANGRDITFVRSCPKCKR